VKPFIVGLFVAICCISLSSLAQHPPATCVGFIEVMKAAVRSQDPLGPQAYINLADRLYVGMNSNASGRGMPPLPLPADENSEAERAMVVVGECQRDMSLKYSEAVALAYIKMRTLARLPVR